VGIEGWVRGLAVGVKEGLGRWQWGFERWVVADFGVVVVDEGVGERAAEK